MSNCQERTNLSCPCKDAYYCTSAHQKLDWLTHKQDCKRKPLVKDSDESNAMMAVTRGIFNSIDNQTSLGSLETLKLVFNRAQTAHKDLTDSKNELVKLRGVSKEHISNFSSLSADIQGLVEEENRGELESRIQRIEKVLDICKVRMALLLPRIFKHFEMQSDPK